MSKQTKLLELGILCLITPFWVSSYFLSVIPNDSWLKTPIWATSVACFMFGAILIGAWAESSEDK